MGVRLVRGAPSRFAIALITVLSGGMQYLLPVSMPVRDAGAFAPLCGVPFGGECKVTDVLVRKERFTLPVDEEGHVAWVNRFTLPFNR